MKIVIGSDHGGFHLKEAIRRELAEEGYEVKDVGTHSLDSCDYPLIAQDATAAILAGEAELGILICHDVFSAKASRAHNNANILTMGERVIGPGLALEIVHAFLESQFEGGRHERRVNEITALEQGGAAHE